MPYPLLSEYIESIKSPADYFDQLKHLRPVLNDDGTPVMTSGNFAVVFKMKDEESGQFYAVKCFLRDQEHRSESYRLISEQLEGIDSPYLTTIKYLENEIYVDTKASQDREFPVLLMDWVEGKTLDKYIREYIDNQYVLSMLAYRFSQLAMWLLPQPFAHGDLKPDNIIVKEDGSLVLVDYDGMYVPAMKGQLARELGSPDFRHPLRTDSTFNEHIDDFSIVSILLSLKAISLKPTLLQQYGASDRLLFSERDYCDSSNCGLFNALHSIVDAELNTLCDVFYIALNDQAIPNKSLQLLNIQKVEIEEINYSDAEEYIPVYDPSYKGYEYLGIRRFHKDLSEWEWDKRFRWFDEHYYQILLRSIPSNLKKGDKFWLLRKMPSIYTKTVNRRGVITDISWVGIPTSIGNIPYRCFFSFRPRNVADLYLRYYGKEIIVVEATKQISGKGPYHYRYIIHLDEASKYQTLEQYKKDEQAFQEHFLSLHNGHEYVDLGLSVKWATCNIGANYPDMYGDYYAWGENNPKNSYNSSNYSVNSLRYRPKDEIILNAQLIPSDDVAHNKWGGNWRMPSIGEFNELIDNCDFVWTTTPNGITGLKIISNKPGYKDNYIFLPCAGCRNGTQLLNSSKDGFYWSSSFINFMPKKSCSYMFCFDVNKTIEKVSNSERWIGLSVRPVCTL